MAWDRDPRIAALLSLVVDGPGVSKVTSQLRHGLGMPQDDVLDLIFPALVDSDSDLAGLVVKLMHKVRSLSLS